MQINKETIEYYNKKYSLQEKEYFIYFLLTLGFLSTFFYFFIFLVVSEGFVIGALVFTACMIIILISGFSIGIIHIIFHLNRWRLILIMILMCIFWCFLSVLFTSVNLEVNGLYPFVFIVLFIILSLFPGYLLGSTLILSILQYKYFKLAQEKMKRPFLTINTLISSPKVFSIVMLISILFISFIIILHYYYNRNPWADKSDIVLKLIYVLGILIIIWVFQELYKFPKFLNKFIKSRRAIKKGKDNGYDNDKNT